MKKNRRIFLDIDGVLNNAKETEEKRLCKYSKELYNNYDTMISPSNFFPGLELFKFCFDNDIKITLSSSWKCVEDGFNKTKEYLAKYYGHYIIDKIIEDATPCFDNDDRGEEIKSYMDDNKTINEYLIIDDNNFDNTFKGMNYCKTSYSRGLTFDTIDRIKKFFNVGIPIHNFNPVYIMEFDFIDEDSYEFIRWDLQFTVDPYGLEKTQEEFYEDIKKSIEDSIVEGDGVKFTRKALSIINNIMVSKGYKSINNYDEDKEGDPLFDPYRKVSHLVILNNLIQDIKIKEVK